MNCLGTKFLLKVAILIFLTKFVKKRAFSKIGKVNTTMEFCILELVLVANFNLNVPDIFLDQICPRRVFSVEDGKNDHRQEILQIGISLSTKFQLKLTVLIFWTKFTQKGTEFCIFQLF